MIQIIKLTLVKHVGEWRKGEINIDIDLSYLAEPNDSGKTVVDKLVYMVDVTDSQRPYYSILCHPINSPDEY